MNRVMDILSMTFGFFVHKTFDRSVLLCVL